MSINISKGGGGGAESGLYYDVHAVIFFFVQDGSGMNTLILMCWI